MSGQEPLVALTIQEPFAVYQSDTHANRHVLYRPSTLPPPLNRGFIRAIVEYRGGEGWLITAFHTMAAKKRETRQLWPVDDR